MRISCIVPIYGIGVGENKVYFEKLLESVYMSSNALENQFELIIVNDDKNMITAESIKDVCAKYGLQDRLIYHENETNRGQAFSRNVGASLASGDYLHFIDQDDYISGDFYASYIQQQVKADFYIALPYFDKNGIIKKAYTVFLKKAYKNARYISDLWYLLLSNIVYSPGQMIMSKSAFDSTGGFPVLEKRGADDFALFYKLVFSGENYKVSFIPESRFYYRIHSQQNSKLSSTNDSAREFLSNLKPIGFKQKLVYIQKTKKLAGWLSKFFYITFFKRA